MRKRLATIALVCAVQYAAVGLGTVWGLGAAHGVRWLHGYWSAAGWLAVLMLIVESVRYFMSRQLGTVNPVTPYVCIALGSYAVWLMFVDPFFVWDVDDVIFAIDVMLLVPFLLMVGPLIRAGAWLGVAGSTLFVATSIAMLIRNGFSLKGSSGFFGGWVS
jgi:hypothetical protein